MSGDGRPDTAWTSASVPPLRAASVLLANTANRPSSAQHDFRRKMISLGAFLKEDSNGSLPRRSPSSVSPPSPATPGGQKKLPPLTADGAATGPVPAADASSPSPRVLAPSLGAPSSVAGPSDETGREARLLQAGATSDIGRPSKRVILRSRLKQVQGQQAMEERQQAVAVHGAARAEYKESAAQGNMDECVEALSRSIAVNSKCDVLHRTRADCHARLGASERALADAQRAASLNPLSSKNFFALGRIFQQRHAMEKAAAEKAAAAKGVDERASASASASAAAAAAAVESHSDSTPPTHSTLPPLSPRSPRSPRSPQGRAPRQQAGLAPQAGRVPPLALPGRSKDLADSGACIMYVH